MKKQTGVIDWQTVIVFSALMTALCISHGWSYRKGFTARDLIAQQDDAKRQAAERTEATRQGEASRTADNQLRDQAATLARELQESKDHAKTIEAERDRALRDGRQRLSIRATSCAAPAIPAERAAQHAGPGPQEARAELLAEDAANLAAITADAEDATRELNSCIDQYNAAKQALDTWKTTVWKGAQHVEAAKSANPH
ncbi:lysis protein [Comamonas piscis]|uniref:Lysis protein n=1 Tax=Comamonas piscis TaxID=1562974 RepID=A0A7G5EM04_9BURK|nr:lysis system i-spanin subunit Rz [Comamonas piscis]QMV75029.1 lysis protein [Comamonas piscis]WSO33510.1 lysis system i-spanin subunit Rz [Comamonas piscis]